MSELEKKLAEIDRERNNIGFEGTGRENFQTLMMQSYHLLAALRLAIEQRRSYEFLSDESKDDAALLKVLNGESGG